MANLYDLTNPQKSIWLTEEFYNGTSMENIAGSVIISEKVNFKLLERAINLFVKSNDSCRLKFIKTNDGIKQFFEKFDEFSVETIDVATNKDVEAIEKDFSKTPFNILDSKLYTFKMFKFLDGHGGFSVNIHHLISDAWTGGLVIDGIINIYATLLKNPSCSVFDFPSYLDYINSEQEYLNSAKFEKDKAFWEEKYKEIPETARIPSANTLSGSTSVSCVSKRKLFKLPEETIKKINEFSKKYKASAFNFLMGVFALYIGRVSNLDEFVIGTPVLNRGNFKGKHTTGMFISTVPFKVTINHEMNFSEFISGISSDFFDIFRHQKYPYQYLLESLRKENTSVPNLYDVMISYQNMRNSKQSSEIDFTSSWVHTNYTADSLDIHFFDVDDTGTINVAYDYQTAKYTIDDICALHSRILHIINQILENENVKLKELEIVTPDEKNEILYKFNDTKMDYPKDKTISELFEEQVEKTPDNIAVVFEDEKLTYKELNEKANSLAHYLRDKGIGRNDIVGVHLEKNIEYVVSILAILKLGATFIPLSTLHPNDRVEYILKNSRAKLLISNNKLVDDLHFSCEYLDISNKMPMFSNNPGIIYSADNTAYILYTSGSTGNPKGVQIRNYSLINHVYGINRKFNNSIGSKDNSLSIANMSFDANIQEIFIPLLLGSTLHLLPDDSIYNIKFLANYIIDKNITFTFLPPNILDDIFELLKENTKIKLNKLLVGVESIKYSTLNNLLSLNSTMLIHNGYGPTEATICCISYMYSKENMISSNNFVPIGTPLGNSKIIILNNASNKLQPLNTPGEICILGDCISSGYVDNNLNYKFTKTDYYNDIMYKTGDYAYMLDNHNLMFVGRIDNQVKIRGHRIELQEINNTVQSFDTIKKSVTVVNNSSLICFFTSNTEIDLSHLKKFLSRKLPYYMIPFKFIQLESLPMTTNGKIDNKKLISFSNMDISSGNIVAPRNEQEKTLHTIFCKNLNIDNCSVTDNFFDIGGDSLSAIRISLEILKEFSLDISVQDIFSNPTIEQLCILMSNPNTSSSSKYINGQGNITNNSLSSAQRRIYYASNIAGENSILYNIPGGIILDKIPDIKKLENCFNILIDRHEAFRTYFELDGNNVVQKIKEKIDFKIDIAESIISSDNLKLEFDNFAKPFDLSKAPLLRARFIRLDNKKCALFVDMHHITSDGTSSSIFINELCKLYNGNTLDSVKITYKDFSAWENNKLASGEFKEAEDFWVNQFEDDIPVLSMPTIFPRPAVKSYEGAKIHSSLDSLTTERINKKCKELGITPYMFLLSIYYILLYKYSGQEDIIVGSPIVGRNSAELYNVIGMFVNTLPMRAKIDSSLAFKDFLNSIKNICLENYKYQDYPLDELVNKLNISRDTSRNPLFDTIFIYQSNGNATVNFDGIKTEYYIPDTKVSKFDLSLEVIPENDILNISFEYCTKLFNKDFIKNMSCHYSNILNTVLDNLDVQLSTICMLSEDEKNKILYEFNNTKMDYPKDKTISELFEEQVEKTPDNIAVVFEDEQLTYKELNEKANSLANYLLEIGISKGNIVPVLLDRSDYLIISMLAIIKIGAIYLPLSNEYPMDRLNYIFNDSNAKFVITHSKNNLVLQDSLTIVNVNEFDYKKYSKSNISFVGSPLDTLYIIYTSGSTGNPKGVSVMNKNLNNFIHNFNNLFGGISCKDKLLASTNICFDVSIFEFYISLLNGATLHLYDESTINDIFKYCNTIIDNNITMLYIPPNILNEVYSILEKNNHSLINKILIGVEPIKTDVMKKYYNLNSDMIIVNGYGPTETTICSTACILDNEMINNYKIIPIGRPLANLNLFILDKSLQPVPFDVPGELYIVGDNVSKGYINNKEQNEKNFVFIPESKSIAYKTGDLVKWNHDGNISFIGRNDSQVKINGHRIELGEIEKCLYSYPNINKVIVLINKDNKIVAYFSANTNINIVDLKTFLQSKLPLYFIPNFFVQVDKFKLTSNGKIDKKALLNMKLQSISNYEEAHTEKQKQLVNIFESILNVEKVGINDNFFELGGDSLIAIKLQIEAFNQGIDISYKDIFDLPTIKQLSEKVSFKESSNLDDNYDYSSINSLLNSNINLGKIKKENFKNILLTGSTGFMGSHILDYLLKHTRCNIYCLIRAKKGTDPQTRLLDILHFYFGNKYDKLIFKRIFVIEGDIIKNSLGIPKLYYDELGKDIDCVINSAAIVKHYGSSDLFNEINILGTQNIINFCNEFKCKLMHISTLSVCGNIFETDSYTVADLPTDITFTEKNLFINQDLSNIYIYTKFVAERLILENIINKNLDAKIIRLGNITNRYSDGKFQINVSENAFLNRLKSFLQIGSIPDYIADGYTEFTPVDVCAEAIVKLSFIKTDLNIFHVYNNNHVLFKELITLFNKFNVHLSIINNNDFNEKITTLLNDSNNKNNLSGIINDFDDNKKLVYNTNIKIKNNITNNLLKKLYFKWPKVDARYIKKYIVYLKSIGYLK